MPKTRRIFVKPATSSMHFQDGICAAEDEAQDKLECPENAFKEPPSSPTHFQDGICAAEDEAQDKLECLENAFEEPPSSPTHFQDGDGVFAAENEAQDKVEHLARMPKTRRIFVRPATSSMDFTKVNFEPSIIGNSNEKGPKMPEGASLEERSSQMRAAFYEQLRSSSGMKILHRICQGMPGYDLEVGTEMADILALNHLRLVTEHYFDTCDKHCDNLMYTILSSPKCNLDIAFQYLIYSANERFSLCQESDEQVKTGAFPADPLCEDTNSSASLWVIRGIGSCY
ncbi:uncharacterized protein LOC121918211 [Sceloporus undulatus]|uniref:uncharacterized protein LOC121918211 n=1 Tax=Sceloporus undulatus TaxID=8520 RepID=UPI001C4B5664|nr:uncharacterized protein LOC121918211 [Sceloporus undulatus]